MVATAIYSVAMVVWKETSFSLWTAMERRWKNQDVDVDGKHVRRRFASIYYILCPSHSTIYLKQLLTNLYDLSAVSGSLNIKVEGWLVQKTG